MRYLISLLALSVAALAGGNAYAKDATAQQGKMATCNKDAADKKGDERKAFMKECLSAAKPAAAAPAAAAAPVASAASASQGSKLGACSKEAAAQGLKGAERNKYLSECGKKKA
ncbi:PsiF family protein [soil metagenome]